MIKQNKHWKKHYLPPEINLWQGRADTPKGSCFFQIIKMLNLLENVDIENIKQTNKPIFALLGFCCDQGVQRNLGRKGAALGPQAIRPFIANLTIPNPDVICYDAGNIQCLDDDLETAQDVLSQAVHLLLARGITPLIVGGGHEVALGSYQGIATTYSKDKIGIINFDAHFDMRPLLAAEKGSSGTPFLQIANNCQREKRQFYYSCIGIQPMANTAQLFKIAEEHQVHFITAEELYLGESNRLNNVLDQSLLENDKIYLTICLDVFAQSYAPGVSAPQALGLTPWQVIPLLRQIAHSKKTICYDITELAPQYDIDNRTIKLAASMIYEIIANHHQ